MEDKIIELISEIKPGADIAGCADLFGEHVLTSFDVVRLVSDLSDEFDVDITPLDIVPENFRTVKTIAALIERLEDE